MANFSANRKTRRNERERERERESKARLRRNSRELFESRESKQRDSRDSRESLWRESLDSLESPESPHTIISLTSFPARIRFLKYTLLSLFTQSAFKEGRIATIALYLSKEQFQMRDLPRILRIFSRLKLLQIHFCDNDFKAYKKLIYALRDFPHSAIITLDDDQFYAPNTCAILLDSFALHCISCHLAYETTFLRDDKLAMREELPSFAYRGVGVGGILYPPNVLDSRIFDSADFMRLSPNNDDLWFHAMAVLANTRTKIARGALGHPRIQTIAWDESPNLFDTNIHDNLRQMQNIFRAFPSVKERMERDLEKLKF